MANHYAGQEVCACTYDVQYFRDYPRLLAEFRANRVYDSGYDKSRMIPSATDSSPFYTSLHVSQDLKEPPAQWGAFAYPYYGHESNGAIGHYSTSYVSYSRPEEVISIKKPPTREMTATLKAWLNEHKKNPYPTKAEKIMLAIITKMTLTQVSTWFANARRRLKKDNKVTWEVKNKAGDGDNDGDDDDRRDEDSPKEMDDAPNDSRLELDSSRFCSTFGGLSNLPREVKLKAPDEGSPNPSPKFPSDSAVKPRIWSLADTAMSPDNCPSDHVIPSHLRPLQLRHLPSYSWTESAFERIPALGLSASMQFVQDRDYTYSNAAVPPNLAETLP